MKAALRTDDRPRRDELLTLLEVTGLTVTRALPCGELSPAQAKIILRFGDDPVSVKEMGLNGTYIGSNVSYNLARLERLGYLKHRTAPHDRRVTRVSLSTDGLALRARLRASLNARMAVLTGEELAALERLLTKLGIAKLPESGDDGAQHP